VGNRRLAINQETLGCPVIAVGVPTVIHAATIVSDAMELVQDPSKAQGPATADELPQKTQFNIDPQLITKGIPPDGDQDRRELIHSILEPYMGNMIVTPKEIDVLIDDVAEIVAGGLNAALHRSLDLERVFDYLQG
jgi:spore protease